jgi:hypothetical protein
MKPWMKSAWHASVLLPGLMGCTRESDRPVCKPAGTFVRTVVINGRGARDMREGGSTASAINLAKKWHPGMTARVEWERCNADDHGGPMDNPACRWIEKDVPIQPYGMADRTHVYILEGDDVLILPSRLGPGHADYPGPDGAYPRIPAKRESCREE